MIEAERLHGDLDYDGSIPRQGPDDRPGLGLCPRPDDRSAGPDPPAARCSTLRAIERGTSRTTSCGYSGILQTRARVRPPLSSRSQAGPDRQALSWSHARRKFFELADIAANARRGKKATPISPIALEAVKRIDAVFDIEREIVGLSAAERLLVRRERSADLVRALEGWMRGESAPSSPATPRSPRRSTTCSNVGRRSRAFSTTAASA